MFPATSVQNSPRESRLAGLAGSSRLRRPSRGRGTERISSRLYAQLISSRLLAGESTSARSLIVDLSADCLTCVLGAGEQAIAVWRVEIGELNELALRIDGTNDDDDPALESLREAMRALLRRFRLTGVASSIEKVIFVHDRHSFRGRFLVTWIVREILGSTNSETTPQIVGYEA